MVTPYFLFCFIISFAFVGSGEWLLVAYTLRMGPSYANKGLENFLFHQVYSLQSGLLAPNYLLVKVEQFCNRFLSSFDWFYWKFCMLGTWYAIGKKFLLYSIIWALIFDIVSIRAPQRKLSIKIMPLNQSDCLLHLYENWT